jgi:hypothetical protein
MLVCHVHTAGVQFLGVDSAAGLYLSADLCGYCYSCMRGSFSFLYVQQEREGFGHTRIATIVCTVICIPLSDVGVGQWAVGFEGLIALARLIEREFILVIACRQISTASPYGMGLIYVDGATLALLRAQLNKYEHAAVGRMQGVSSGV